jgi:uncharacterized protein (TIGR02301 family)
MKTQHFLLTTCVSLLALGSVVAFAQNAPLESTNQAPPEAVTAPTEAPAAVAPFPTPAQNAPSDTIEDAPIDMPAQGQSDWAPDINLDTLPPASKKASGYVQKPKPRKSLSDAGETVLGTGSWSQSNAALNAQADLMARAQRRERATDPRKRADLTKLSRVMGALHALRVSCAGRDDQTYRSRMATLLDLEAPGNGDLRDPLVDAFNGGFQAYGRGASACPSDARAQEANLAKDGYMTARALGARYRPAPKVAAALPPATQPRQNAPAKTVTAPAQPQVATARAKGAPPGDQSSRPSWNTTGQ